MAARSKERKRALDILYAADARDADPLDVLDERIAATGPEFPAIGEYAGALIRGYVSHARRIDDLISQHAEGWTIDRMPAVDRSILRIATYELLYATDDVPPAVAVDEAVEAAKTLSTDNSPRFVNGVLGQIMAIASQLRADRIG